MVVLGGWRVGFLVRRERGVIRMRRDGGCYIVAVDAIGICCFIFLDMVCGIQEGSMFFWWVCLLCLLGSERMVRYRKGGGMYDLLIRCLLVGWGRQIKTRARREIHHSLSKGKFGSTVQGNFAER